MVDFFLSLYQNRLPLFISLSESGNLFIERRHLLLFKKKKNYSVLDSALGGKKRTLNLEKNFV